MPGTGASSGGGTETSAFGSWDETSGSENIYPVYLDLDARPGSYAKDPYYRKPLRADSREREAWYRGFSPLDLGCSRYDLGES